MYHNLCACPIANGTLTAHDACRPHAITVLGRDFVVWRDQQGDWRAFDDVCPHRLAPLSGRRSFTLTLTLNLIVTLNFTCAVHLPAFHAEWHHHSVHWQHCFAKCAYQMALTDTFWTCHVSWSRDDARQMALSAAISELSV